MHKIESSTHLSLVRAGLTAAMLVGVGFTADGFWRAFHDDVSSDAVEAIGGLSLATSAYFGRRNAYPEMLLDFAASRRQQVLTDPNSFPLHQVDIFLEDEQKARIALAHDYETLIGDRNARIYRIRKSRERLRDYQMMIKKDLQLSGGQSVVTTPHFVLMEDYSQDDPLEISQKIASTPNEINRQVPTLDSNGYSLFDAPTQPTKWQGISFSLYRPLSQRGDWHCILSFDQTILPKLLKEKILLPLPRYHR